MAAPRATAVAWSMPTRPLHAAGPRSTYSLYGVNILRGSRSLQTGRMPVRGDLLVPPRKRGDFRHPARSAPSAVRGDWFNRVDTPERGGTTGMSLPVLAAACDRPPYDSRQFRVPARSAVGLFHAPSYDVDFADLIGRGTSGFVLIAVPGSYSTMFGFRKTRRPRTASRWPGSPPSST